MNAIFRELSVNFREFFLLPHVLFPIIYVQFPVIFVHHSCLSCLCCRFHRIPRCPSPIFKCKLVLRTRTKEIGLVALLRSRASQVSGARLLISECKVTKKIFRKVRKSPIASDKVRKSPAKSFSALRRPYPTCRFRNQCGGSANCRSRIS